MKRNSLTIINKYKPTPGSIRSSCTPFSMRRQIYISLPNQFKLFEKAVLGTLYQDNSKTRRYAKKRLKILQNGIKRLDRSINYIISKKLPAHLNKNSKYSDSIVRSNKKMVATACAFIKYTESKIVELCDKIDLKPFKFFVPRSSKYDLAMYNDLVGYRPELRPPNDFVRKWMKDRYRFSTINKLGYHMSNAIRRMSK